MIGHAEQLGKTFVGYIEPGVAPGRRMYTPALPGLDAPPSLNKWPEMRKTPALAGSSVRVGLRVRRHRAG